MIHFKGNKSAIRRESLDRRDPNMSGWLRAMKPYQKTTITYAAQISEPFEVETLEGLHTAKAGDWLAVGARGEMYPIDAAIFADSYEEHEWP